MNIAVIGAGYVGSVTACCLAEMGNRVICVDNDPAKVGSFNTGNSPIFEIGLDDLLERNLTDGRLQFTGNLSAAIADAEIVFLALPTPPGEDGSADLSYVLTAAADLAPMLSDYTVIVNKSTVPVGTAEAVTSVIADRTEADFDVVSNPEFLREGQAIGDFMKPDRIVIGAASRRAADRMERLYQPFVRQGNPILTMDVRSAELTKYAANAYLATRISFMNEMANLCERTGADINNIRAGMGSDSRIGKQFLYAGIGYGGSCFPKDVKALRMSAEQNGYDFQILGSVLTVNQRQRAFFCDKIDDYFRGKLTGRRFALWGVAFKPNTDDIREAPARTVIEFLLERGAEVVAFDPEAGGNVRRAYPQAIEAGKLTVVDHAYDALDGAEALLLCTEWPIFRSPDFRKLKQSLDAPVLFDGRNLYDLDLMERHGFDYFSVGRRTVFARSERPVAE